MIRKLIVGTVLVVMASMMGLLAAGPAYAAAATGTGPDQALAPGGDWQPLVEGATKWYAFQYAGDSSQIQVWLDAVPAHGATFSIWTPEQIKDWANGQAVEPIGRGSTNAYGQETLSWSGNFNMAGAYYIVVEQSGPQTTYYAVNVTGSGVTVQAAAAQQTETVAATTTTAAPAVPAVAQQTETVAVTTTTATTTSAVAPAAAAKSGASPDQAFSIPAYSVSVAPGASIWHTFQYAGDESQIHVWLNDQGQAGLSFSVWTPEQVRQWQAGNSVDPVGRGSYDADASGDLSWAGNFPQNGAYFVQVTNTGSAAIVYTLNISGSGVW